MLRKRHCVFLPSFLSTFQTAKGDYIKTKSVVYIPVELSEKAN